MKLVREVGKGFLQWVDTTGCREATTEEIAQKEAREKKVKLQRQILRIKRKFEDCKYLQEKYVDGALSEEEYAPIRAQRQQWRDEINALETQLSQL